MKDKFLAKVPAAEAKRFLVELANLRDDGVERLQKRFGNLIPYQLPGWIVSKDSEGRQVSRDMTEAENQSTNKALILNLRKEVRKVWVEPDLRTKRYGVFLLWKWAMFTLTWSEQEIPSGLPPPTPFEQIIQILIDEAELVRYCGNPECLTPYFIASRRNQKYCSDACSVSAQRAFKRQWWAEHGEEWRASRAVKKSSKKKTKKKER